MSTCRIVSLAALLWFSTLVGVQAQQFRVTDVPDTLRQAVIEQLQKTLVYPELAIWQFDYMQPYPTEGVAVCGRVNYPNSTRRYVGYLKFFAHMRDGHVIKAGIVSPSVRDDPVLSNATAYKIACS